MNKLNEKLAKNLFKRCNGSVREFAKDVLKTNQGKLSGALPLMVGLLACDDDARIEVSRLYLQETLDKMRSEAAIQRANARQKPGPAPSAVASAKQTAPGAFEKRDETTEIAGRAVHAMSDEVLDFLVGHGHESREFKDHFTALAGDTSTWYKHTWYSMYMTVLGEINRRKMRKELEQINIDRDKAQGFDRMVLLLDAMKVGSKPLGDCTGGDLLREAARLEELANAATVQSTLFRQLAALVGKTTTVREANQRGKIIALLSHSMKEGADV